MGAEGRKPSAAAARVRKRMLPGTSPCCEPAQCSQLRLEMQRGSANSQLSGAAARAAVWSGPLSCQRRARSPQPRLPPRAAPRLTPPGSPPPFPSSFFFFFSQSSTSCCPTFLSLDASCSGLRTRFWLEAEDAVAPHLGILLIVLTSPLQTRFSRPRGSLIILSAPGFI